MNGEKVFSGRLQFMIFPLYTGCKSDFSPHTEGYEGATDPSQSPNNDKKMQILYIVLYSVNYMRSSTIYYKIVIMLDDFVQPWAKISVLSILKVGKGKL
jgi:hypothetical protein